MGEGFGEEVCIGVVVKVGVAVNPFREIEEVNSHPSKVNMDINNVDMVMNAL